MQGKHSFFVCFGSVQETGEILTFVRGLAKGMRIC